jgi:hypothetical protein
VRFLALELLFLSGCSLLNQSRRCDEGILGNNSDVLGVLRFDFVVPRRTAQEI